MEDAKLIGFIKENKKWATNQLYLKHFNAVRNHLIRKGCPLGIWQEFYNDAFVVFHETLCDERFLEYDSIAPWLKKVAKNGYLKSIRNKKTTVEIGNVDPSIDPVPMEPDENIFRLKLALEKIGDKCRHLINLTEFADKKYSGVEIAEILGYNNANVVFASKTKCLKKLREIFENI